MKRGTILLVGLVVGLGAVSSEGGITKHDLGDFLGVASGSSTRPDFAGPELAANPPFVVMADDGLHGIGRDTAGNFSGGAKLRFTGLPEFEKGIGMHSALVGFSVVQFDLSQIAPMGTEVFRFVAYAGIDLNTGGIGVSQFQVLLGDTFGSTDGDVLVMDFVVNAVNQPVLIDIETGGARTLTLRAHSVDHNGAHAAFGDAFVLAPEPGTAAMVIAAAGMAGCVGRGRRLGRSFNG